MHLSPVLQIFSLHGIGGVIMEEYLEEQRRRFTFAAADVGPSEAAASSPLPAGYARQPTFSPFSTLSSSTSSDISDFILELRQGYGNLKCASGSVGNSTGFLKVIFLFGICL